MTPEKIRIGYQIIQKSFSDLIRVSDKSILNKQFLYNFKSSSLVTSIGSFSLIDIIHIRFSASKIFCYNLDSVGDLKSNIARAPLILKYAFVMGI